MTETHKRLIASYEKQEKAVNDFMAEVGDNMTDEQYAEATRMRDDLRGVAEQIERQRKVGALRGEVEELRKVAGSIEARHQHPGGAKVLGSTKAGESVFHKADGSLKRNRSLQLVRETGPGAWGKAAFDAASHPDYRRAFCDEIRGRRAGAHFRLLEDGIDSQGGYLAPVELVARLIERKPAPTSVSAFCETINTARDAVSLPRVNYSGASDDSDGSVYTTGVRATLTDENPTSSTQSQVADTNLFGSIRVAVYTWMMQAPLTLNVLEDATFDPLAWIASKFGETLSLLKDKMAILGADNGPVGILTNPGGADTNSSIPVIKTGTSSSPFITPDSLINMTEDIPTQYDSNVRYLYRRRSTGKAIRTFKDAQGRYLFGQGTQDSGIVPGRNQVLNDYPVAWSDFMPDPAANAYPVVAGDFGGVTIVNRVGMSVQVLREVAAQKGQVIVIARVRFGVQVLEPWRLRALQCN